MPPALRGSSEIAVACRLPHRLVPVTTISTVAAAALAADQPGRPVRDRGVGAITLRHLDRVGLDLGGSFVASGLRTFSD
jgi:hypothetical protein